MYGGGPGGQPPSSPKTGLFVAIGCAAVVVLGIAGAGVAGAMFWTTSASAPGPSPVTATPVGGAGAPGPTCSKTAACCRKIVTASGGDPSALTSCDNFQKLPDSSCTAALEGYKKSATLLNVQCD